MGKYVLLVVASAVGIWGLFMVQLQSDQRSAEKEAQRQKEVLARQAARSGLNVLLAKAKDQGSGCSIQPSDLPRTRVKGNIENENYDDSYYDAELNVQSSGSAYRIVSKGWYREGEPPKVTVDRLIQVDAPTGTGELVYVRDSNSGNGQGNQKLMRHDGKAPQEIHSASQIEALGSSGVDFDGDDQSEIPYVDNGKIEIVDASGDTEEIANPNGPQEPRTQKTKLSAAKWRGQKSALYVGENKKIYRVTPNNGPEPELVANPDNSANAVLGTGDIDGDGDSELMFADGSQHVRYIEQDDGTSGVYAPLPNGGAGSNEGIGAGTVVNTGGKAAAAVFVDGEQDIRVVNDNGKNYTIEVSNNSSTKAEKSSPTVADIDGDNTLEVVYIAAESHEVKHVDINSFGKPFLSEVGSLPEVSLKQDVGLNSLGTASNCSDGSGESSGGSDVPIEKEEEWCANSDRDNYNENGNGNWRDGKYTYDYSYRYAKGTYRYSYQYSYSYEGSEGSDEDPDPNPDPDPEPSTNNTCGEEGMDPNPDPNPDPDPDSGSDD